ncbi:MAG: acyltransferase [Colwellia sp.]|nr:acyltransferase [Colwellia sp.]
MRSKQIHALTGVRGIAALWVVILHGANYTNVATLLPEWTSNLINKGWLGVDLFFILSGFVIAYVHQKDFYRLNYSLITKFLKLRLARIYPAHLVATLILLPIVVGASVFSIYSLSQGAYASYDLKRFLFSITLTNGWGIPDSNGWNFPSWSVASEWFAYLMFPPLAWAFNKIKSAKFFITLIFLIFFIMHLVAITMNDASQYMPQAEWILLRVASEFIIGCCLFNLFTQVPQILCTDTASVSIIGIIIFLCIIGLPAFFDGLIIILFSLLILNLSRANGFVARVLSSNVMNYLGRISYSIYLTHFTVLIVYNQVLKRTNFIEQSSIEYLLLFYIGYIAISIISGNALFSLIENPCRRFLRTNWIEKSQKAVYNKTETIS